MKEKDIRRFHSKYRVSEGCWNWKGGTTNQGYGRLKIGRKYVLAHRLMAELSGRIPGNLLVCHHCDNPKCVKPDHLFVGTHHDNRIDSSIKGRTALGKRNGWYTHPEKRVVGEKHPAAKLIKSDVLKIKSLREGGLSTYKIAKIFHVAQSTIFRIIHKKSWRHV